MALVGTIIRNARAEMPDPVLQVMTPPNSTILGYNTYVDARGTIPSGTVLYVMVTAINPWGETTFSTSEVSLTVTGPNNAVQLALLTGKAMPPGATALKYYFGTVSGAENQWVQSNKFGIATILGLSAPNNVMSGPLGSAQTNNSIAGIPPQRNTAWLPDTDGDAVSAGQIFGWFNDGLTEVAKEAGGIQDRVGLNSTTENMFYVLPGRWLDLSAFRWDQWGMQGSSQNDIFYRYNVTGVSQVIVQEVRTDKTVIALWPIPNLSGSITTLTSPMTSFDQICQCVNNNGFTANQQFQIDDEQIAYSGPSMPGGSTTQFSGLIRGIGGTKPYPHNNGAIVQELKITLYGYRFATWYHVGDSLMEIDAPPSWELPLKLYILSAYKAFEQDIDACQKIREEARREALKLRTQKANAVKSKQIGGPMDSREWGMGRVIVE